MSNFMNWLNNISTQQEQQRAENPYTITSNDPSKWGSASGVMGRLLRAEWDDYEQRFGGYDNTLIKLATRDEDNQAAIARARSGVAGSFDVAQGANQRDQSRLGLSNVSNVSSSLNRQTNTNRTLSELGAINQTRLHAEDRDKSIMAGDAAAGLKSSQLTGG